MKARSYPFQEGGSPRFHRESFVCCRCARTIQSLQSSAHPATTILETRTVGTASDLEVHKRRCGDIRVEHLITFSPIRRFSGLISRWMTCFSWQYMRARASEAMYCTAMGGMAMRRKANLLYEMTWIITSTPSNPLRIFEILVWDVYVGYECVPVGLSLDNINSQCKFPDRLKKVQGLYCTVAALFSLKTLHLWSSL